MTTVGIKVPVNHVTSDGERVWMRLLLVGGDASGSVVVELSMSEAADLGRRLLEPPMLFQDGGA